MKLSETSSDNFNVVLEGFLVNSGKKVMTLYDDHVLQQEGVLRILWNAAKHIFHALSGNSIDVI